MPLVLPLVWNIANESGSLSTSVVAPIMEPPCVARAPPPPPPPLSYGDLRLRSDRRRGACLYWTVPDVSPGFNVPDFYAGFLAQQQQATAAAHADGARPPPPPPPPSRARPLSPYSRHRAAGPSTQ